MRFLVDTNVFLDFFVRNDESRIDARLFFQYCYRLRNEIYVTSMSMRDIGYVAQQKLHDSNLSRDIQIKTYDIVSKICDTSADAAIEALYSDNNDYEDELQITAAKVILADAIVTNDKKGFKNCGMDVFSVKQANELMSKQHPVVIE